MATPYFDNFPNVYYANTLCKDITRRAVLQISNTSAPHNFYPYDIQSHLRSDHIAEYYYEEPQYDWMVYLANKIVDPYYGWYNDDQTLDSRITEEYGSLERAQQKIKHYVNNWADDDTNITPDYYNNNLVPSLRKYWSPVFGPAGNITGYIRAQNDTIQNTNQIWQFEINVANNATRFSIGELATVHTTGVQEAIGRGEVETSNTTVVRLKNISGSMEANSTVTLDVRGVDTGANHSSSNSYTWFYNISNGEFVYYSAVSCYDWEVEQNEARRSLLLVGDGHVAIIDQEFEQQMKQDVDLETGLSTG